MKSTPSVQQPGDAKLLDMVWAGDTEAFGVLYERHVTAALRLARLLVASPAEADDAVAHAFGEVLELARQGNGVSSAVRPDVLTRLRQMCDEQFSRSELSVLENTLIAHAYFSLPDSWRTVLWHTEVEQAADADVAPLLGVPSSGAASLRRRAAEGLRQAYLDCGGAHEDEELDDVGATLRAVVGPIVLGSAAARYLEGAAWQAAPAAAGTAADGRHAEPADWDDIYDPDAGPDPAPLPAPVRRRFRLGSSRTIAAAAGLVAGLIVVVLAAAFIHPGSAPGKANSLLPARSHAAAAPTPLPSAHSPTASPSRSPLLGLSTNRSPSPSAPPGSSPPVPAPTSDPPAPASAQLSASIDPGQPDDFPFEPSELTFQVSDSGLATTGPLTASVTIPGDVQVLTDGVSSGGWSCQPSGSNGATCTHSALSPGQSAEGTVEYTPTCGEFSVVVTSGSLSATADQDGGGC